MEPNAEALIQESAKLNLADEDEYPHVIQMQERCVNMLAHLYHADQGKQSVGTSSVGSSEAVMLAGLAMKWNWRKRQKAAGKPTDKPNLIMGENVQVVWEKFARYFDVEPRYIPVTHERFIINAEEVLKVVDENTIGVVAILGSTFTGEFEPIELINDALVNLHDKSGLYVPLHVDAASGGFVAPFIYPNLKWDFRLKQVVSINVSGHKYGMVYPGVGWVIWRDQAELPEELVFHVNYLGGDMPTFTLNFSRPAAYVVAQYYNFLRLGFEGYKQIISNLKKTADYLAKALEDTGIFTVIGDRKSLPLVAWKVHSDAGFDAFELSARLRGYGWIVPAYTMPKNAEDLAILRVVVREHFSRAMADDLIDDIKRAISDLQQHQSKHKDGAKSVKVC